MNFWDKITGGDMTRQAKDYDLRAEKLPPEYQAAWESVKVNLYPHSDITGRKLMQIFDGVLCLLEESASEGQGISEVLGEDVRGFCMALLGVEGTMNYRDKWREQLNRNVAKKLGK